VLDGSGNPIGGLSVSLNGAVTVNTDGNGNYTFGNIAAGGNYTVTPSSANYSFSPTSQTFDNLNVNRVANFVGTRALVSIAGNLTDGNNVAINNVTMSLTRNGTAAGSVQTDGLGNYSFGNLAAGAYYVVTPAGTFTPSSQSFSNLTTNGIANFKAAPGIPSQCNTAGFAAASNFAVGTNPQSVALGDFNGDGKLDLAVANLSSNNVSILLGTGVGTFSAPTNFAVDEGPVSVAVGDFNGDGKLDLATANEGNGSRNVSILLGTGSGTFGAATSVTLGGNFPTSVAVGDFNGDGKLDLAVPITTFNGIVPVGVSILLGTGTGSFSAATTSAPVDSRNQNVAVGDFNGDGKLDLAVAGSDSSSILLGDGTGSFSAPTNVVVGGRYVAVGDFNGDGKLDLAMVDGNSLLISLGDGKGSFSAPTNFAVGNNPQSAALARIIHEKAQP
jgi:hypothetical protein